MSKLQAAASCSENSDGDASVKPLLHQNERRRSRFSCAWVRDPRMEDCRETWRKRARALQGCSTRSMRRVELVPLQSAFLIGVLVLWVQAAAAQDLEPRAYSVSPVGTSFIVFGTAQSRGSVVTDPTLPIEDATAVVNVASVAYFRSMDFFGRSANFTAALPYGWGTAEGRIMGEIGRIRRSGLVDARFRV